MMPSDNVVSLNKSLFAPPNFCDTTNGLNAASNLSSKFSKLGTPTVVADVAEPTSRSNVDVKSNATGSWFVNQTVELITFVPVATARAGSIS